MKKPFGKLKFDKIEAFRTKIYFLTDFGKKNSEQLHLSTVGLSNHFSSNLAFKT
jgi:hypothetical protein